MLCQAKDQKAEPLHPNYSPHSLSNHLQAQSHHWPVTQFILLWRYSVCHFTALQSTVCQCRNTLLSKEIQQKNSLKCNLRCTTKWVILWISLCQVSLIAPFLFCHFTCSFFFAVLRYNNRAVLGWRWLRHEIINPFQQVMFSFFPFFILRFSFCQIIF